MMRKLEQFLFYVFLISIPFSIRHIFGYEPVGFMEWQAISLYVTDILLAGLIVFWLTNKKFRLAIKFELSDWLLIVFAGVSMLSIPRALDINVAWYHWAKLLEGIVLYWYVKNYVLKRFSLIRCFEALVVGGLIQSVVAITQFMMQKSIGLKYLGESVLNPNMIGIAAFFSEGDKIMRAYGTTVHSNVLAAYLFLALTAFIFISFYQLRRWYWYAFHAVSLWAFLLTFSRTIIAIWVLNFVIRAVLFRFYPKFKKTLWGSEKFRKRGLELLAVIVIVVGVFTVTYYSYARDRLVISSTDEGLQLRGLYNREALSGDVRWLGVGPGNFVPWLMRQPLAAHSVGLSAEQYQPVHNIYLLIYAETGLLGLVAFLSFLAIMLYEFTKYTRFREMYHISFALVFGSLLVFGLFDHFLWTIQSGALLFWLTAGLLANTSISKD